MPHQMGMGTHFAFSRARRRRSRCCCGKHKKCSEEWCKENKSIAKKQQAHESASLVRSFTSSFNRSYTHTAVRWSISDETASQSNHRYRSFGCIYWEMFIVLNRHIDVRCLRSHSSECEHFIAFDFNGISVLSKCCFSIRKLMFTSRVYFRWQNEKQLVDDKSIPSASDARD